MLARKEATRQLEYRIYLKRNILSLVLYIGHMYIQYVK